MIKTFADKETEKLFKARPCKRIPAEIRDRAFIKLILIDQAPTIDSLREPQSNHLEKLHGDREGDWSIRVNLQWRICFAWEDNNAYEVEIDDYH